MRRALAAAGLSALLAAGLVLFGIYAPAVTNPYPSGPRVTPTTYGPPPR